MRIVIRKGEHVLRSLPLRPGARLSVGREPEGNDIVLPDPKVSRQHGSLVLQDNHLLFTDLESGNGTYLTDKRLPPNTPAEVPLGTRIEIGDHSLTLEEGGTLPSSSNEDETRMIPPPPVPEGHVGCLQGLGGLLRGQTFPLGSEDILLGRFPDCHIQVVDGLVSRHNARIRIVDGIHHIDDLKSSNGTFVNKERLHATRPLRPGDEICVGEQLFLYRHIPESEAPPLPCSPNTATVLCQMPPPRPASTPTDRVERKQSVGIREGLLLLAVLLVAFVVWRGWEAEPIPESGAGGSGTASHPVTLIAPIRLDIPVTLEATGNLHPAHATTILLPLGQRVQTLWAEDQQTLEEGDRILTMELTEPLRAARTQATAAVKSAEAEIAKAKAEVEKTKGALDLAKKNLAIAEESFALNEPLYEAGHLVQQEWNQIRNSRNNAEAEVTLRTMERKQAKSAHQQTQAQAEQVRADLKDIEARIRDLEVHAKSAGVLDGLKVNPGDTITPESRVLRVLEYKTAIKVIVPVPEDDIPLIRRGMPAEVWLSRAPDRVFRGTVTSIPATATHRRYDVEIRVPNEDGHLRPGAQAMVRFHIETREGALCLPTSVLSQAPHGDHRIFVFDASTSTVRAVPVRRGAETLHAGRRMVEVRPVPETGLNLEAVAHVIFDGHRNLQDGSAVNVTGATASEAP